MSRIAPQALGFRVEVLIERLFLQLLAPKHYALHPKVTGGNE